VDSTGGLLFSGYIRLLSTDWSKNTFVTISWSSRSEPLPNYGSTEAVLVETGSGMFGPTYYHSFSTPIDPATGISSFAITVTDGSTVVHYENGGSGYPISDTVISMPSTVSSTGLSLSAAVLTSILPTNVTAVLAIPTPQEGSLKPQIITSTVPLTESNTRGLYTVYTGSSKVSLMNVNQTSVDIVAVTSSNVVAKSEFKKLS